MITPVKSKISRALKAHLPGIRRSARCGALSSAARNVLVHGLKTLQAVTLRVTVRMANARDAATLKGTDAGRAFQVTGEPVSMEVKQLVNRASIKKQHTDRKAFSRERFLRSKQAAA